MIQVIPRTLCALAAATLLGCGVSPPLPPLLDFASTAVRDNIGSTRVTRYLTADGASLALQRRGDAGGPPILLIHGLALNAESWNLPDAVGPNFSYRSLGTELAAAGFDVWSVNLRGHGDGDARSEPPPHQLDWTIDDFILFDVPAAVDCITTATGKRPFVLGSSLGCMALAGWLEGATLSADTGGRPRIEASPALAAERQTRVTGAVLIAFPAAVRWADSPIDDAGRVVWAEALGASLSGAVDANTLFELTARSPVLISMLENYGRLPLRLFRPDASFTAWREGLPAPIGGLVEYVRGLQFVAGANLVGTFDGTSNTRTVVLMRNWATVVEDVKAGVIRQFARSVRARAFVSDIGDPPYAYSDHYANISLPTLLVLGGRDRNANADVARTVFFDAITAGDKTIRVFDAIGHGEFELAPIASHEAYPEIVAWLAARIE